MSEIKNYVEITFQEGSKYIHVDGDSIPCNGIDYDENTFSRNDIINPPENVDEINQIVWDASLKFHPQHKGSIIYSDYTNMLFDEEKYNDWVKPFVDIFQAKKDEEQQQQEEIEAEYNKFENRQARALARLNADFETAAQRAHVKSSLGFEVDANSTANENINGLLITIGDGTVQFCDYYNGFHELNKAQLETLQAEIIQNAQSLYAQKWQYRTAIEQCSDNEGLDQVVAGIEFTYMDFTQTEDTSETVTE